MNRTNLFTILFLVLLGGIGYLWYSTVQSPAEAPVGGQSFTQSIAQLARLRTIDIDTTVFQDPVFMSLEAPPVPLETVVTPGRVNPFLKFR
ncbi:MAG: hypothetical protein HYT41_01655 [Candidatus Sungbacteria bacterium]|nr:hypothetical protein [Candidatus Sungbacteria bacterium]